MRDQIAKLAEAQKSRPTRPAVLYREDFDFDALLVEFDCLSKIEAALEGVRGELERVADLLHTASLAFGLSTHNCTRLEKAIRERLAPSTGESEKQDG